MTMQCDAIKRAHIEFCCVLAPSLNLNTGISHNNSTVKETQRRPKMLHASFWEHACPPNTPNTPRNPQQYQSFHLKIYARTRNMKTNFLDY
jgi:hypothetical protein